MKTWMDETVFKVIPGQLSYTFLKKGVFKYILFNTFTESKKLEYRVQRLINTVMT